MNVEEILAELDRKHTEVPRIALEEAVAQREEIIPHLLAVLEDVARDPALFAEDKDRNVHIYAMYLLAQFRETRAYSLLVKIFSAPGETPFELAGSVVTQDLTSILASVSDGDVSGMVELVENESANDYVRGAALDGGQIAEFLREASAKKRAAGVHKPQQRRQQQVLHGVEVESLRGVEIEIKKVIGGRQAIERLQRKAGALQVPGCDAALNRRQRRQVCFHSIALKMRLPAGSVQSAVAQSAVARGPPSRWKPSKKSETESPPGATKHQAGSYPPKQRCHLTRSEKARNQG